MQTNKQELHFKKNRNGPTLGYTSIPLLEIDGLFFKNLERTGRLLLYEDWRLDPKTRAENLAKRLSKEEIAGLMMYSPHQVVPALPVQLPRDMKTVEEHGEDTPLDMEPYVDAAGNAYDFGFGLSFSGRIQDERTEKYTKQKKIH